MRGMRKCIACKIIYATAMFKPREGSFYGARSDRCDNCRSKPRPKAFSYRDIKTYKEMGMVREDDLDPIVGGRRAATAGAAWRNRFEAEIDALYLERWAAHGFTA